MPMYEYQCRACQARFERLSWGAKAGASALRCECGSSEVERIWYSRVAVGHGGQDAAEACGESCGCAAEASGGEYGCGAGACGCGPN